MSELKYARERPGGRKSRDGCYLLPSSPCPPHAQHARARGEGDADGKAVMLEEAGAFERAGAFEQAGTFERAVQRRNCLFVVWSLDQFAGG